MYVDHEKSSVTNLQEYNTISISWFEAEILVSFEKLFGEEFWLGKGKVFNFGTNIYPWFYLHWKRLENSFTNVIWFALSPFAITVCNLFLWTQQIYIVGQSYFNQMASTFLLVCKKEIHSLILDLLLMFIAMTQLTHL